MNNSTSYQKKELALTTMLTCFFINFIFFFIIGTTPTENISPVVSNVLINLMCLNLLIGFGAVVMFQLNRKAES